MQQLKILKLQISLSCSFFPYSIYYQLICILLAYFIVCLSSLECKLHEGRDFHTFGILMYLCCLKQGLAYIRCSSIFWILKDFINFVGVFSVLSLNVNSILSYVLSTSQSVWSQWEISFILITNHKFIPLKNVPTI